MLRPVTGALPRFDGPAQGRQRLRLVAAVGMLAVAALGIGGAASLARLRAPADLESPEQASTTAEQPSLIDPAGLVEARIEEAEAAVARARLAVRSARQLGVVDPRLLDDFERRLDRLTGQLSAPPQQPDTEREPPPPSRSRYVADIATHEL
jgi:hypothetical protein